MKQRPSNHPEYLRREAAASPIAAARRREAMIRGAVAFLLAIAIVAAIAGLAFFAEARIDG